MQCEKPVQAEGLKVSSKKVQGNNTEKTVEQAKKINTNLHNKYAQYKLMSYVLCIVTQLFIHYSGVIIRYSIIILAGASAQGNYTEPLNGTD